MALKKGVCKNFDNCDLADKNEIQEVESTEFKCSECGKDLHEIQTKTATTTPNKKLLIIIVTVVVIGGGVAAALLLGGKKESISIPEPVVLEDTKGGIDVSEPVEDESIDDNKEIKNDSLKTSMLDLIKSEKNTEPEKATKPKQTTTAHTQPTSYGLGWAKYEGPMKGGKPHGVGGTLKITRRYSIDLKDGLGSTLDVYPGETIENTKFENGQLRAGELHRHDGTRPYFNI